MVLSGWSDNGEQATFQIFINPLINFLWFGGVLLLAGAYLALAPRGAKAIGRWLYWIGAVLFIGLAVWMMWGSAHGATAPDSDDLQIGSAAPRFETLTDLSGTPLALDFAASPVTVVNFWAPWCPSCQEELPDLQAIWEKYEAQGLALLGITYDTDQTAVQASVDSYGLTYPIVLDPDAALSMQYQVTGVPETYIVDRSGRITFIAIGAASFDEIEAAILESLAQTEVVVEGGS